MSKKEKAKKPQSNACVHILWTHAFDRFVFTSAEETLSLIMPDPDARAYRKRFWDLRCQVTHRYAADILRAAQLPALTDASQHVERLIDGSRNGGLMSPLLLVRGNYQRPLVIADGYYRVCASHYLDELADIPVVLI